eukprot:scaffold13088_cov73-Isochrysis_galbana.AAC.1
MERTTTVWNCLRPGSEAPPGSAGAEPPVSRACRIAKGASVTAAAMRPISTASSRAMPPHARMSAAIV